MSGEIENKTTLKNPYDEEKEKEKEKEQFSDEFENFENDTNTIESNNEEINNAVAEKIYLPKITKIQIEQTNSDSIIFKTPKLTKINIKEKNKIFAFNRKFRETNIIYIIQLYNPTKNLFENKEEISIEDYILFADSQISYKNQVDFLLLKLNNLQENKFFIGRILIKFSNFYSEPSNLIFFRTNFSSKKFAFYSMGEITENSNRLFINKNNYNKKNNFENFPENEIQLIEDNFHKEIPILTNLNFDEICDFHIDQDFSYLLISDSNVISSGKKFEAKNFLEEKNIKIIEKEKQENIQFIFTGEPFSIFSNFVEKNFLRKKIWKLSAGENFCVSLDTQGNAYSWGINNFGQLGNGLEFDEFSFYPNEVKFPIEKNEKNFEFFVYDLIANDYSVIALCYLKGKKKVFQWGLGDGHDLITSEEKFNLLMYFNTIENNKDASEVRKSKYPFEIKLDLDVNSIVKVTGKFKIFNFLVKNQNNFGINFALGNTSFLGFPSLLENKGTFWFRNGFIKLDFFEENKLSIIDTTIGDDFLIYLVHNLTKSVNELYFYGCDRYNFFEENEAFFDKPEKINFKEIKNPIRISAGKKSALVLDENLENCDTDNKGKIKGCRLFEIGDYFNRKGAKEGIKEIKDIDFCGKEIVKMDCFYNNVSLLLKE